jgi:hypothetical protein
MDKNENNLNVTAESFAFSIQDRFTLDNISSLINKVELETEHKF